MALIRFQPPNPSEAWRQMVFYLSMLPEAEMASTLDWMEQYFEKQPEPFQLRFRAVFDGLKACAQGTPQNLQPHERGGPFLGWSDKPHWLMS